MPRPASCRRSYSTIPFAGGRYSPTPAKSSTQRSNWDWDFLEPRTLLVGSPDNVAEKIQELQEVCNLDYLLVEFAHFGIPQRKMLRNLENFGTKVMPRFAR